jgi:hypothetical protein
MLKKSIITGIIFMSLLVTTMNIVVATNVGTFIDDTGDVLDETTGENRTDKINIDIKELQVSKDYRQITIVLTVEGIIENKGNPLFWQLIGNDDLLEEYTAGMTEEEQIAFLASLFQDFVIYNFDLLTSENLYSIIYGNKEVIIFDGSTTYEGTNSVSDNSLTISFRLPSSNEYLDSISVFTYDLGTTNGDTFFDEIYGELDDEIPTDGENNGDDDDDNGSPGFELITLLVAIVIGVLLIRKKRT